MTDFNVRAFYKETKAKEEVEFSQRMGMSIRNVFQQYNEGSENEEIFALKTISNRECFGIEFQGSISYLLPVSHHEILIFIFDRSLMPIIEVLSNWTNPRIEMYGKHTPSLLNGISNAIQGNYTDVSIFVDEDMLCFAKQIEYSLFDNIKDGYIADYSLIEEVLALVLYRNKCSEEIISFDGFSSKEENEIVLKEGLAIVKKGLKYIRFMDFFSNE